MHSEDFIIFPPNEAFYIVSMLSCTESALISARAVAKFIRDYDPEKPVPPQAVLNQLQNIALQGAAISRFFWPSEKYRKRGKFLRDSFSISDDIPLKSRDLRNRMEHYDEYLDDYFEGTNLIGTIIPDYIGYEPQHEEVPYHLFRAFFMDSGSVSILGVKFELQPLIDEIKKLNLILVECKKNGSRFPKNKPEQIIS